MLNARLVYVLRIVEALSGIHAVHVKLYARLPCHLSKILQVATKVQGGK